MCGFLQRRTTAAGVVVIALVAASLLVSPPGHARATGAQRVPALCIANILDDSTSMETLNVNAWTPLYPMYWDVTPPVGAWASATGYAVVTPSGRININCDSDSRIWSDTANWPVGTYTLKADFGTVIGGDVSGFGGKIYRGRATVTITNTGVPGTSSYIGRVTISGHLDYAYTT